MTQPPPDPYGQQPYGQPYGQQPYGQYPPQPGQPLYQPPSSNSNKTVWIVLGIIGVVIVLFCGGCLAVGAFFANEVDNAIEEEQRNNTPHEIEEGGVFEHDDYRARAGWKITTDELGHFDVEGLVVENQADNPRSASLKIFVYADGILQGTIGCSSPTSLASGDAGRLDCSSVEPVVDYDTVKVADSF